MRRRLATVAVLAGVLAASACSPRETVFEGFGGDARRLRVVNRQVTRIPDRNGVQLSPASGNGVAWVEGTDFRSGTIEVDIRGREELQQTYVGVAFHRQDDDTYEAVYLRPFNFRAAESDAEAARRPVHLAAGVRLAEAARKVPGGIREPCRCRARANRLGQAPCGRRRQQSADPRGPGLCGDARSPETRRARRRPVGLWVGNVSGGAFANLVVTPAKQASAGRMREAFEFAREPRQTPRHRRSHGRPPPVSPATAPAASNRRIAGDTH